MRPIFAIVPFLPIALLACDAPAPVAAEDFPSAYAAALCERAERCFLLAPHLADKCRADVLDFYADDIPKGIAAGRLTYDASLAGKCVDGVGKTRCVDTDVDDDTLAACYGALQGTIAPGQPCDAAFECASGVCGGAMTTACPATCPEVLAEGDSCSLLSGPECDLRAGQRCSAGVCVRPGDKGAACVDRNACKSGLVCFGGKCDDLRREGQGCAGDSSCASGLFCEAGGDEGGICQPRVAEGGACAAAEDEINAALKGVQCQEGLVCKGAGIKSDGSLVAGACARPAGQGEACQNEPEGLQVHLSGCLDGLVCAGGKCAIAPDSGACAAHFVCRRDTSYCDAATTTCMPLKATGDACAVATECEGGDCVNGACADTVLYCHEM